MKTLIKSLLSTSLILLILSGCSTISPDHPPTQWNRPDATHAGDANTVSTHALFDTTNQATVNGVTGVLAGDPTGIVPLTVYHEAGNFSSSPAIFSLNTGSTSNPKT